MKVFLLATGQDTAGTGGRIASAFSRLVPNWDVASMTGSTNYMLYGGSLRFHPRDVQRRWDTADVIHLRNAFDAVRLYGRRYPNKPLVIHHHGTIYRNDHVKLNATAKAKGVVQLVSTVDLMKYGEDLVWCPSPYSADYLKLVVAHNTRKEGTEARFLIAHAPTNREIKGTETVLKAIEVLQGRGYPVDLELIERQSWRACIARKSHADLYIDQFELGYGCNTIEAWGMGIPVIAGATPEIRKRMISMWGELPFVEASEDVDSIIEAVIPLIESKTKRDAAISRGMGHFTKYHDDTVVVPMLKSIYERQRNGAA